MNKIRFFIDNIFLDFRHDARFLRMDGYPTTRNLPMVLHDISVRDLSVESTIMNRHREKYAYHVFSRAHRKTS